MTNPLSASETLDREFFEIRAGLLRVAASLDRIDRGDGDVADDPRRAKLLQAIKILETPDKDRAEKLQMLFSLPFDEDWASTFGLLGQSSNSGQHN